MPLNALMPLNDGAIFAGFRIVRFLGRTAHSDESGIPGTGGGARIADMTQPDVLVVHVARLDTEDDSWISVHYTAEDAMQKLHAVAEAWGVGPVSFDDGPLAEIRSWSVTGLPVMNSAESAEYPEKEMLVQLPDDPDRVLLSTFKMLAMKDAVGGLSAEEIAGDIGVTADEAARRLAELASHDVVCELSPGRYRVRASARWSER